MATISEQSLKDTLKDTLVCQSLNETCKSIMLYDLQVNSSAASWTTGFNADTKAAADAILADGSYSSWTDTEAQRNCISYYINSIVLPRLADFVTNYPV